MGGLLSKMFGNPSDGNSVVFRFFTCGTGGAGKTTIIRQLKCLCRKNPDTYQMASDKNQSDNDDWRITPIDNIFSEDENQSFVRAIRANIVTAVVKLINQTEKLGRKVTNGAAVEGLQTFYKSFKDMKGKDQEMNLHENNSDIPSHIKNYLVEMLEDEEIKETLRQKEEAKVGANRLEDGTIAFLSKNEIDRIFQDGYVPTDDDIVRVRAPTTTMDRFRFIINHKKVEIFDMGGQPTELQKFASFWKEFEKSPGRLKYLWFIASLSDFNVRDMDGNIEHYVMDRSLDIYKSMLDWKKSARYGVVLLLNKKDRFRDKVVKMLSTNEGRKKICDIYADELTDQHKRHIRNYDGNDTSSERLYKIISMLHDATQKKYEKKYNNSNKGKGAPAIVDVTSAVDSNLMNETIRKIVIAKIMNDAGRIN